MSTEKISLDITVRAVNGKKVAQLRHDSIVPGVVYGHGSEPINVQAPLVALNKVVLAAGKNKPIHLTIEGKKHIVLVKSVDRDPVKHLLQHVAFHAVNQKETVVAEVPIELVGLGESPAERAGLVILQALEKLDVRALPLDLPETFRVDIGHLTESHQQVTVADIKLPKDIELAYSEDVTGLVIASVYEPSALQAANDAAGGDAEASEDKVVAEQDGAPAADAKSE